MFQNEPTEEHEMAAYKIAEDWLEDNPEPALAHIARSLANPHQEPVRDWMWARKQMKGGLWVKSVRSPLRRFRMNSDGVIIDQLGDEHWEFHRLIIEATDWEVVDVSK